jgi:hypothetical protein
MGDTVRYWYSGFPKRSLDGDGGAQRYWWGGAPFDGLLAGVTITLFPITTALVFATTTPTLKLTLFPITTALVFATTTPTLKLTLFPITTALVFATTTPTLKLTLRPTTGVLTFASATPLVLLFTTAVLHPTTAVMTFTSGVPIVKFVTLLSPGTAHMAFGVRTPIVTNASFGVYNYDSLGGDPTEYSGPKLSPVDPNPTIGRYGYEQFD